jgi:hypothetical protein
MFRFYFEKQLSALLTKFRELLNLKREEFSEADPRSGHLSASSHVEKTTVHVCDKIHSHQVFYVNIKKYLKARVQWK